HAPVAAARRDLVDALATQIENGHVDRAALQPKIDAQIAASEAARGGDRAAIERLHAILDAEQRSQLVDAIESRFRERMHGQPGREHMREWASALQLTDDQRTKIRDAFMSRRAAAAAAPHPAFHEGMQKAKHALESFK